jgi:Mce-associated membrane protein
MGGMDVPETDDSAAAPAEPTLAGRALRALRSPRPADAGSEPVRDAPGVPPGPVEPASAVEPVSLAKVQPVPDVEPVDDGEDPEPDEVPVAPAPRSGGLRLVIAAAVLAVLALAYAVVGLAVHLAGTGDSSSGDATARDDVVTAARIDVATLYTLSYHNPQAGVARWRAVSTGGFEQQIAQQASTVATAISKAKLSTSGRVVAAAVTDLDAAKGTATVIASMDVTKTPASGASATTRNRFRANMQRVNGVWKVADLSQVEVQLS